MNTTLEWKGRPVPWVTRWTNEIAPDRYEIAPTPDGRISYAAGLNNYDPRDPKILWQREGIMRGGEPEWANVSTYRQRAAMRRRMCQVCGTKIPDGPIRWLMPLDGMEQYRRPDGEVVNITMSAPTCDGCVDVALKHCPHMLGSGAVVLTVEDYSRWGVSGLLVVDGRPMNASRPYVMEEMFAALDGHPFLAQQLVVQLGEISNVEAVPPKGAGT